jgi:hypothetical protein
VTPEQFAEIQKKRSQDIKELDTLGGKILELLGQMTTQDAMGLVADLALLKSNHEPYSPAPAEYQRLQEQFVPLQSRFSPPGALISIAPLNLSSAQEIQGLRKANEAIFCSGIFAGGLGQRVLDQSFLETFVPFSGSLSEMQANIWLELKTRAFITAMQGKVAPAQTIMLDLFPPDMANKMLARRPGSTVLLRGEEEFLTSLKDRKSVLQDHVDRNVVAQLDALFPYIKLGKAVTNYLIETHVKPVQPPREIAAAVSARLRAEQSIKQENGTSTITTTTTAMGIPDNEFIDMLDEAFAEARFQPALSSRPAIAPEQQASSEKDDVPMESVEQEDVQQAEATATNVEQGEAQQQNESQAGKVKQEEDL